MVHTDPGAGHGLGAGTGAEGMLVELFHLGTNAPTLDQGIEQGTYGAAPLSLQNMRLCLRANHHGRCDLLPFPAETIAAHVPVFREVAVMTLEQGINLR